MLHNLPLPEPSLLGLAGGWLLQRALPWSLPGSRRMHAAVGAPGLVAGASLVGWSTSAASRVDLERPGDLVTAGPYAVMRNPMYVGWHLLHLGFGVIGGSCWVLVTIPIAAVALHREILREEQRLDQAFCGEFRDYCNVVPRYGPVSRLGTLIARAASRCGRAGFVARWPTR